MQCTLSGSMNSEDSELSVRVIFIILYLWAMHEVDI